MGYLRTSSGLISVSAAALTAAVLGVLLTAAHAVDVPQLLIGFDDDRQDNVAIQAGAATDQSLKRTDIIIGGPANDVMFGLNGNDFMDGRGGRDIILGGPDGGTPPGGPPNSDIMFGGFGNDVNLWAPGDGSEAFIGGPGSRDALVFGSTDRELIADPATGVRLPTLLSGILAFPQGIPTADVSGVTSFCTIEASPLPDYEFLVRFLGVAGNLIVTVRVSGVEQVFCSGQGGGAITFADLTDPFPSFIVVSHQEVSQLNSLVGKMIR
jgi:RTX calcium-binding nonapeptide repeat (4 copies)